MSDLAKRLRIKAGMIEMGERIAWGSDSALMREAADALEMAAPAVQGEPDAPALAEMLTSDLSARINRVSKRSLDGSVVMYSEEWNGIVELVKKLLIAAPQSTPDVEALVDAAMETTK